MFPDTMVVRPYQSQATFMGGGNFGTSVNVKCKITGKTTIVRDPAGKEQTSSLFATTDGHNSLTVHDEYTLPVRFDPRVVKAISVEDISDENGPHHQRVFFP